MSTATPKAVVAGLGRTGLSCVRHLRARGYRLAVTDTRAQPPGLAALLALDPAVVLAAGGLDAALLEGAALLAVSPGLATRGEFFDAARARAIPVVGDIELFAREVRGEVAAITGTNGKSTVTTLLGRMAARAGCAVQVGGNLGEPALDLLARGSGSRDELYVLELSSFQLETTHTLALRAAAVLNLTPDHLDRYDSIEDYAAAKARIFAHCDTAIVNLDDARVAAMPRPGQRTVGFSIAGAAGARWSLLPRAEGPWLARAGEPLLPLAALRIPGLHNAANALAALALGEALGLELAAMLDELREFAGLDHRAQWVAEIEGVRYVDDSKGTNVGATIAAIEGLPGPLVLIAGGDGKNQDFAPLAGACRGKVRHAVLIGRDAPALAATLAGICSIARCATLPEAVGAAQAAARPGDTVLLSPACASLDMFRDYAHRGEVYAAAVRALQAGPLREAAT